MPRRTSVAVILCLVVATLAAGALAEDAPVPVKDAAPTLADLAWLTGAWSETEGPSVFSEVWGAPLGDAMVAASHWSIGGKTRMYELVVIEQTEAGLVLHVRHFHRGVIPWPSENDGPMSWPLKSLDGQHVVFEHPTRAWPKVMEYRRVGKILEGRLAGAEQGRPKEIPFRFALQD